MLGNITGKTWHAGRTCTWIDNIMIKLTYLNSENCSEMAVDSVTCLTNLVAATNLRIPFNNWIIMKYAELVLYQRVDLLLSNLLRSNSNRNTKLCLTFCNGSTSLHTWRPASLFISRLPAQNISICVSEKLIIKCDVTLIKLNNPYKGTSCW